MARFRNFRKIRKGRKARKTVARKQARKTSASAFKKRVLKVLHSQVESKQAFYSYGLTSFNSGINVSGDALQVVPNITTGAYDNNRIGDQVRAQSLTIKGYCIMNLLSDVNNLSNRKIAVRMIIGKVKRYGTLADTQSGSAQWMPVLLKKGGTVTGFTGVISDLWAPINTDIFTKCYDRVFYMSQSPIIQATAVGLAAPSIAQTTKVFSVKIPLRNRLFKYDLQNDSGLLPVGEGYVMVLGYAHMDGSSADVVNTQVSLAYDTVLNYEDA